MIRTLNKVDTEGIYLNTIKVIYNQATANIILNSEKVKAFPLRLRTSECPLLPLLFNIVLAVPVTAIRKKK